MGWNGSGVFNRLYSWVADKAAAIDITASRMDNDTNDIVGNGLGNCLTRDGQGIATANLPMGNFKHTGVGKGTSRTDYADVASVQDALYRWAGATAGTSTAYTLTPSPAIAAYVTGQSFDLEWHTASGAAPTLAVSGLPAKNLYADGPLGVVQIAANDLITGVPHQVVYDAALNGGAGGFHVKFPGPTSQAAGALNNHGQVRLSVTDATHLKLAPYNGGRMIVGGKVYNLASAGISITNTSLATSTNYYAYAYDSGGGTLALELSTTGHATDATTGVEVKSGDASRTLVGMIRTNTSGQFVDALSQRFCINWFNRLPLPLIQQWNNQTTSSTTPVTLTTSTVEALTWSDCALYVGAYGNQWNNVAANAGFTQLYLDGGGVSIQIAPTSAGAQYQMSFSHHNLNYRTEGYHYAQIALWAAANSESANGLTFGLTWG